MTFRETLLYRGLPLALALLLISALLAACRVKVTVPEGGYVLTESGSFVCYAGDTCTLDASDTSFDETFIAVPTEGHHFAGWERGQGFLCGGATEPCRLQASNFSGNETIMAALQQDVSYPLIPRFVPSREFNFAGMDAMLQYFLQGGATDGFSVLITHRDFGVIFERAYGDFSLDRVVQLRSASKLASATLMMALDHHGGFDIQVPIANYLPFEGVYGDRTGEQLLSQTSGIPGNAFWVYYQPHLCQYETERNFDECGKEIYQSELPSTEPAGTRYSYGGSQWQLAGLAARFSSGRRWEALFHQLIANPCDMTVFQYGNMVSSEQMELWDGNPENLTGKNNPNIEGGAISNLRDYGKLIALHLNDGWCGNHQILSPGAVEFMRVDRKKPAIPPEADLDGGYGLGAFINDVPGHDSDPVYVTPGALGTVAWIDSSLDYGVVFMAEIDNVSLYPVVRGFVGESLIPQIREIMTITR